MHTAKMTGMAKIMPSQTAGSTIQCRIKMDPVGRTQGHGDRDESCDLSGALEAVGDAVSEMGCLVGDLVGWGVGVSLSSGLAGPIDAMWKKPRCGC